MNKISRYLKNKKFITKKTALGIPYGVFMTVFVLIPIIIIIFYAFSKPSIAGNLTFKFSFENLADVFSKANVKVLGRSIWMGLVCTLICFVIGYPAAYFLSFRKYTKQSTTIIIFIIPIWINFLLRTLATKAFLGFLGAGNGYGSVIFGMVYNFIPFMILPIYTSITKIDLSLIEASSDLGATPLRTFLKVVVPLSKPGIASGVTMVFTPTITTYVISDLLSNKTISLIGNIIDNNVRYQLYNTASAISIIVLVFVAISMLFVKRLSKNIGDNTGGSQLW